MADTQHVSDESDRLATKIFVLTVAGAVAFIAAVVIFVL
jgi:hypothetical protein